MSLRSFSRLRLLTLPKFNINHSITTPSHTINNASITSPRALNTSSSKMEPSHRFKTEAGQAISDVARQEGGNPKGSASAKMQSEITKQRNLEAAAAKVASKLDTDPGTVTSEDASLIHSREARVQGGPTKGDLASQAQSVAAANEQGATTARTTRAQGSGANAGLSPAEQSQLDREANFVEAADVVGAKLATEPGSVTKEEGDLLHSRETKVFGATEKGGIASQAQSQAAKNAGDTA